MEFRRCFRQGRGRRYPHPTRTLPQRQHDALEEACQRLIESGMLPGRDGQPLQLTVHVDLAGLSGQPGGCGLEAGWSTARAANFRQPLDN